MPSADFGFPWIISTDLRLEPRELTERGFRFIKASATLLLNRATGSTTNIHPADFSDLLGRFGIDLIADRIETESTVVDLLDYDVRFGQGFLFSPPRPVRPEALQGAGGNAGKGEPAPRMAAAAPSEAASCRHKAALPNLPAPAAATKAAKPPCLKSSSDLHRWRAATTFCCATSGAWCTTALPPSRRLAKR